MQKSHRFIFSALWLGIVLLSACTGTAPKQAAAPQGAQASQVHEVVFTGAVESMGGTQWTISGQKVTVDGATAIDTAIQAGDIVRVEATVSQDGAVIASKIESSLPDDSTVDDSTANSNANDDSASTNDNANEAASNSNENTNAVDDNTNASANSNDAAAVEQEVYGTVDAISTDSITVDGVTYNFADFTEFSDIISVGDQVKLHVIVNADGSFTIREIEKITGTLLGSDDNSNSSDDNSNGSDDNSNGSDDNSNDDDNNSNDDDNNSNDDDNNSNSNSNDND